MSALAHGSRRGAAAVRRTLRAVDPSTVFAVLFTALAEVCVAATFPRDRSALVGAGVAPGLFWLARLAMREAGRDALEAYGRALSEASAIERVRARRGSWRWRLLRLRLAARHCALKGLLALVVSAVGLACAAALAAVFFGSRRAV